MRQLALEWIGHYGYVGLFSLLAIGIVGVPVPDDWLLVFAGYLVFKHNLRFFPAVVAAFAGSACGISVSYGCDRSFGSYLITKYGHFIQLTPQHVENIHSWFSRFGRWAIVFGYFIPGVRHLTAYAAGTSRMPFRDFVLFSYCGALIWSITFISVGYIWGDEWSRFADCFNCRLVIALVVTSAGLTGYFVIQELRRVRQ